ncbi:MAG: MmgE/PrpD family protein [Syntrophorhabdus sp. PtaU1.Bin058]|nr:MAG: MmgE/PrpD family protein [Syntrophorhabdus sp. PtaU1.Bin058]
MELEKRFVDFILDARLENIPREPVGVIKNVVLNNLGAIVGGATSEGCETVLNMAKAWGGKEEATVLVYGDRLPAYNAALVNGTMARALDIDDHMPPGMHVGGSALPTALAAAELAGGCSGKEFLTALVLGFDMAIRINSASTYNGFDPSGVCGIFASIAAGGRILRLNPEQMWNALALGFNRPIQTFQSIVDGTTAVRVGQGLISQAAISCIQMAQKGITGPKNFLEGVYGYFHLYAADKYDPKIITAGLGETFQLGNVSFKIYPSCGNTIASTDAILGLMDKHNLTPENVAGINVRITPYAHNMVGGQFKIGNNPRVDAQFSVQYCVANALLRKESLIRHFDESYVRDPRIVELVKRIHVAPDPALEGGRQGLSLRADMDVATTAGDTHHISIPIPSGFPGNPLSNEKIAKRFEEAAHYGNRPVPEKNLEKIISIVNQLEQAENVCDLIPLMLSHHG